MVNKAPCDSENITV